jgi:hypothetical protein
LEGNISGFGSSKNKNAFFSPTFCPSDLPVKISEVLETSRQRDSSPKLVARLGLATQREFLQAICGWAATRCVESLAAARIAEAIVALKGQAARPEIFSQEDRKIRTRREFLLFEQAQEEHRAGSQRKRASLMWNRPCHEHGGSANPQSLCSPFRSSCEKIRN